MTFSEDVETAVSTILREPWNIRESSEVPSTESVTLKNGAVETQAAFLYADLAGSTELQKNYVLPFAAKAIRMYLAGASSIIRYFDGSVKSFDGDRIMGVFASETMCNDAAKAAFAISWMVGQVIQPKVEKRHLSNGTKTPWVPDHGIGIDSGRVFIARAGIRNSSGTKTHNDLIFTGRAPNVAAKLSALRGAERGPITITDTVHSRLFDEQKTYIGSSNRFWKSGDYPESVGPYSLKLHRTTYWRRP